MTFTPSPQQQAIFDFIANGEGNAIVDAKAGSGKTTTLVEGLKFIRQDPNALIPLNIVFIAFNKSIVETLSQRCPIGTTCITFHALGFRALKSSGLISSKVKIDARKVWKIIPNFMEKDDPDQKYVVKLVGLLKSVPTEVFYEDIDPTHLIEHQNIDFDDTQWGIETALRVLKASDAQLDIIDFDDMLHLAVKLNAPFIPRDWIFVDEPQDLSAIQHEMIARQVKASTRMLFAGDPHQAIYGFRGADSDGMSILAKRFSCKTFPLSVSYRCPKAVVREAQKYLKNDR